MFDIVIQVQGTRILPNLDYKINDEISVKYKYDKPDFININKAIQNIITDRYIYGLRVADTIILDQISSQLVSNFRQLAYQSQRKVCELEYNNIRYKIYVQIYKEVCGLPTNIFD